MMNRVRRFERLSGLCIAFGAVAIGGCASQVGRVDVTVTRRTSQARLPAAEARYLSDIGILAHDELGGRGTGSDGIDLAAGYIAGRFASIGLAPGGPEGTYFQEFSINRGEHLLDETALNFSGCDVEASLREDFVPFGFSSTGAFSGELAFAGYGITNPEKNHDDYAGLDVEGRVVLMFRREPVPWAEEGGYSDHARFDTKIKLAAEHSAVAVLIVNQDPGEDGIDGLMRFRVRDEGYGLPAIHIKRELADQLLAAGGAPSLHELQDVLDASGANTSHPLGDISVRGTVAYEKDDMTARNVIGVLPGQGPDADEYVVIGGHYDHLGVRRGKIHNGADDNASGTAGVIELARMLAETPNLNRSILFIAFTGEEMGLLGSKHFVAEPTIELDSVVAMLNLDMIGRLTPEDEANMLAIQGLGTGESFPEIVERRAKEADLAYLSDASALGPSDHASFYRGGIPSLFFFTGVHEDYHRPRDDTDKIKAEGAIRIVHLVYRIGLDIVNGSDVPAYAEVTDRAQIFRGAAGPGGGVVMGIMPDMDDESDASGWRVALVLPGSGAAKAGMKAGDRILRIDGIPIEGFSDYREATREKKPGDVVQVVVLRKLDELTLAVELSARGG